MKTLIVEDDFVNRLVLQKRLEQYGEADGYLVKPIEPEQLNKQLRALGLRE